MADLDSRLKDKWWRLTHLYKIKDKDGHIVTFTPNYIQLLHLAERGDHRFPLILKARQFGFTTLYEIDLLDEALWNTGMSCGIIAHEAKRLSEYFGIVKRAFENLPDQLKPKTRYDNRNEYEFLERFDGVKLDSRIYVAIDIRGGTLQSLHITESAFIKDRAKLKAGSMQAVGKFGRISQETTGNGFGEFYDDFQDALNNPSPTEFDNKSFFYPWFLHDDYTLTGSLLEEELTPYEKWLRQFAKDKYNLDLTDGQLLWRRWKANQLKQSSQASGLTGDQLFKQEYPATIAEAFQSGAGNVFDTEKIDRITPPQPIRADDGLSYVDGQNWPEEFKSNYRESLRRLNTHECKFWELPEIGHEYYVGVDPSDGMGADFGAIAVWKRGTTVDEKHKKVAEYYGKLRPDELGEIAVDLATFYNKAVLGIENNMLACVLHVVTVLKYDNTYYSIRIDERTKQRTKKIGWTTSSKTRDVMIDDFNQLFDEDELEIPSTRTLGEMRTFVKKDNGKREHANGKHDDMLFADFIAQQMIKRQFAKARVFTQKPVGL